MLKLETRLDVFIFKSLENALGAQGKLTTLCKDTAERIL